MANQKERIVIEAVDNTTRGMRSAQNKLSALDRTLKRVQTTMLGFVGINILGHLVKGLQEASDSAVEMEAKLRLMTDGTDDFNKSQKRLVEISKESGSSLESNIILFTRMNRSIQAMGGSSETTAKLTQVLSQGLRISGASVQESASVVRQFSQAMASGVLRGEEFNAIMENGGRLGIALADGLNKPIGKLRDMAKAGELTAQKVSAALLSQSKVIEEENAKLPLTIGRALQNVNTEWILFLSSMGKNNADLANIINSVSDNFQTLVSAILIATKVAGVFYGARVIKNAIQWVEEIKARRLAVIATAKAERIAAGQKLVSDLRDRESARAKAIEDAEEHVRATQKQADIAKEVLSKSKLQAIDAKRGVIAARAGQAEQQALIKTVAAEEKLEAVRYKSQISEQGRAASEARTNALKLERIAIETKLRASAIKLKSAEDALTLTQVEQTAATKANILAQEAKIAALEGATAATTVASASNTRYVASLTLLQRGTKVAGTAIKGLATGFRALTSAALGLPGLIAFVTYELVDRFGDIQIAGIAVSETLKKVWAVLGAPVTLSTLDYIKEQFAEIEAASQESLNKLIADRQKAKAEADRFNADASDAATQFNRKLIKLESDRNDLMQGLRKINEDNAKKSLDRLQALDSTHSDKLQARLDEIKNETELKAIAIKSQYDTKEEYETKLAELELNAKLQSTELTVKFYQDQIVRTEAYYDKQIKISEGNLNDQAALLEERNLASIKSNRAILASLEETMRSMKAEEDGYLKIAKDAAQAKIDISKDYTNFLREINGDQRAEYQKDLDANKERLRIQADLAKASLLDKKADAAKIKEITDKAIKDTKALVREESARAKGLKAGSADQVQAYLNVQQGLDTLETATGLAKDAQDGLKDSAESAVVKLAERTKDFGKEIDKVKANIKSLDDQLAKVRDLQVKADANQAHDEIKKIQDELAAIKDKVVTITVRHNNDVATGADPVKKADGGFIPRANKVAGSGSGDKVKALLEPGEFIMRKSAVQKYGESAMYALNRGEEPVKRQTGGMIGAVRKYARGGSVAPGGGSNVAKILDSLSRKVMDILSASERHKNDRGIAHAIRVFNDETRLKFLNGMIDSAGSLSGKPLDVINKFVGINGQIMSLLNRTKRNANGTYSIPLTNVNKAQALVALRNALTGGGTSAPTFTAGTHSLSPIERAAKEKADAEKLKAEDAVKIHNGKPTVNLPKDAKEADNFDWLNFVPSRDSADRSKNVASDPKNRAEIKRILEEAKKTRGYNLGGLIQKFADGGSVAGTGLGDTVKALLTPGEFVMKKGAVQSFGQDFFNKLNSGVMPQRFANGGAVMADGGAVMADGDSGGSANETVNVNLTIGGTNATGSFPKNDATMAMLDQLKQSGAAS